ncbi:MAG: sigma-70 family RNA polymerase sigma factor [Alcanivoracaceae bacterium]|nr:sigma-70 family RNA polymerase sigma factor [Alcanivoracaceae bacterium]
MDQIDNITRIINSNSNELNHSQQRIMNEVFNHLKLIAKNHRYKFKKNDLNTTALVSEAWIKLNKSNSVFNDRNHYYAVCSMAMKQILLNEAKKIYNQNTPISLEDENLPSPAIEAHWLIELDKQLEQLRSFSQRLEQIFIYRYFGGMKISEISELLKLSPRTVDREWKKAKLMISIALQE